MGEAVNVMGGIKKKRQSNGTNWRKPDLSTKKKENRQQAKHSSSRRSPGCTSARRVGVRPSPALPAIAAKSCHLPRKQVPGSHFLPIHPPHAHKPERLNMMEKESITVPHGKVSFYLSASNRNGATTISRSCNKDTISMSPRPNL